MVSQRKSGDDENGEKISSKKTQSNGGSYDDSSSSLKRIILFLVLFVIFLLSSLLYYVSGMNAEQIELVETQDIEIKEVPVVHNDKQNIRCQQICNMKRQIRYSKTNGYDILHLEGLLKSFNKAKIKMITKLKQEYGEDYFQKIFIQPYQNKDDKEYLDYLSRKINPNQNSDNSNSRRNLQEEEEETTTTTTNANDDDDTEMLHDTINYNNGIINSAANSTSYDNFKRKMLMKIFEVQTNIRNDESNFMGCDCINGDKPLLENDNDIENENTDIDDTNITLSLLQVVAQDKEDNKDSKGGYSITIPNSKTYPSFFSKFTFVNGGHSASAGHGNLYNESYTARVEHVVANVFESIGIDFKARNHGMGGTRSGLEVSSCSEEIFGNDIDLLTWDYGMLDGGSVFRMFHYFYRACYLSKKIHPALLLKDEKINAGRNNNMMALSEMGMMAFLAYGKISEAQVEEFPDSLGMSDDQIFALPDLVRNIKCEGKVENGEPYCKEEKFSKYLCFPRRGMAGWHPGFKIHAFHGTKYALFLLQTLIDALKDYSTKFSKIDPEVKLAEFQSEEDLLFQRFREMPLPDEATEGWGGLDGERERKSYIDYDVFYKGKSICKTGRLPAQTRYLGYLTNTDKVGGPTLAKYETFDVGLTKEEADSTDANGIMRLAQIGHENTCDDGIVMPDYKDYFYAHYRDDWVTLTIPNEAERKAYNYDPSSMKGVIVVTMAGCNWGRCQKGDQRWDAWDEGRFEMEVNGVRVTEVGEIAKSDYGRVLRHKDGVFFKPDSNGVFNIRFRVTEPDEWVRWSTIVVW